MAGALGLAIREAAQAVNAAEQEFRRAVAEDFPAAGEAFLLWIDARTRRDAIAFARGGDYVYRDTPTFSVAVDRALAAAARTRGAAIEAELDAMRRGET